MKKITFLLILLITSLGFSQNQLAQNGQLPNASDYGNSTLQTGMRAPCSFLNPDTGITNALGMFGAQWMADDVDVAAGENFTPLSFTFEYLNFNPNMLTSLDIYFFADGGGGTPTGAPLFSLPGQVAASQTVIGSAFGRNRIEATYDLSASGVTLMGGLAGTKYWISLVGVSSGGDTAFWSAGSVITGSACAVSIDSGATWFTSIGGFGENYNTFFDLSGDCLDSISVCGTGNPQSIPVTGTGGAGCAGGPTTSPANVATAGVIGAGGGQYTLDNVAINLTHTWDSDLSISLVSPMGTSLDLSSGNGGSGDNYTSTVFMDGAPSITTGAAPFTGTFEAEGGPFAAAFAGESITGNWTLSICDSANGDGGNLLSYCITLNENPGPIGDPPVIACPADLMIDTTGGLCSGVANWAAPIALDTEDGPLATMQTMGLPSGSAFPTGDSIIEYSVTDSDGNTSTCQFTITVTDNEAPMVVCQDLTVELDAAGLYTLDPNDIDGGSTDNCGIVSYEFSAGASIPGSLTTLFSGGNGGSAGWTVFYDITVGPADISVNSFDVNTSSVAAVSMDVYTLVGTSIGNEANAGLWGAPASSGSGTGAGTNNPTNMVLGTPIVLLANTSYGIAINMNAAVRYTNGTGCPGNQCYINADLSLALGKSQTGLFTGSLFSPRIWNGTVYYDVLTPAFGGTFDCSNVGTNIIGLIVTDAQGNQSTCTATVTVEDNIAPEITCIGEPATIVDSSTDAPALAIVDNTTVSTTMNVTDDFLITDLDVDIDITHTWTGDLQITLESPAGTQVLIFDGSADGCSGDNIMDRYDDESANALDCQAGSGNAFPEADYVPSNPLSAFDGESTLGVWTLSIEDTAGGDQGTLNSWTLNYSHDVTGTAFDVILDANGMATVVAGDLIMGITEACGYTVTVGGVASPETLSTPLIGGNGNFGNMFDVNALTDITVNSFDVHGDTGLTFDVNVWAKSGTHVGSEDTPGDWTLLGTAAGVVSNGDGVVTPLNLSLGYTIPAGETHAFFVSPIGGGFNYHNGTAVGALVAADANLELLEGAAKADDFSGTTFAPRVFEGNVVYTAGAGISTTFDVDCSNLGENLIEVTVTDDSGNVATCMATYNVIDVTAPIITCVGPTNPTEMGTVSDSPALAIVDNTTVSTTITVTDDFPMTDLNVNLNITHTWVGDLQITLQSPAGTQVLIFDGGNDGCSGDNILDLYDDESANSLNCQAGTGNAFPEADYMPSNPLSAFDGESMAGVWTLSIQDTAGGDSGTLNNWGITYSYDGLPTNAWPIYLDENGMATVDPADLIADSIEACGITIYAADITEFDCSDVGTGIILVTVFVSDASGNIASCVAEVEVFDNLAPVVTCPADITVDPGPGNLFYQVPDYFATGEATAVDNCTDPVTILSQNPAAGTLLPDGVYPVTMTAEDEYGNVGTCTFTLTIESVLGVDENELDIALIMYPNPAQNQVTITNSSNIQLEKAAIYDMNGKLISQFDLSTMQGEKVIDVSNLATGVYMVQINSDNSSAVKRLIKE